MKHITNSHYKISNEEIKKLLARFIEKKSSKKVVSVEMGANGATVLLEAEEIDLEEPKDPKNV